MIGEGFAAYAFFFTRHLFGMTYKPTLLPWSLHGATTTERIGLIAHATLHNRLAHMAVALIVGNGCDRSIDRDLVKIWAAQTR